MSIIALDTGFNFVAFIGGTRYRFINTSDTIEAFPFTFTRDVTDREHGEIDVEFTLDCPSS